MSEETTGTTLQANEAGGLSGATVASVSARDASDPALLPPENPLAMPPQNFDAPVQPHRRTKSAGSWVPRAAVFAGAVNAQ